MPPYALFERPEKGVLLEGIGGFSKVLVMTSLWLSCLPVLDQLLCDVKQPFIFLPSSDWDLFIVWEKQR